MLPMHDIDGDIQSLQFIHQNGFKQFKTGAATSEGMIWLDGWQPRNFAGVIRLCEGWSTGCTIYSITKSPVVCALNAWNLVKVANLFKRYYHDALIKICADNDQWGKENVGLEQGIIASSITGFSLHYPTFDGLDISNKPTDFNDLLALTDVGCVKKQLILIRRVKK